jgi:hypothetical protein
MKLDRKVIQLEKAPTHLAQSPRVEIDVFALHVRNTETRDSQKIQLPPYSSCKERVESERVESE